MLLLTSEEKGRAEMKKWLMLCMALLLSVALVACGSDNSDEDKDTKDNESTEDTAEGTTDNEEDTEEVPQQKMKKLMKRQLQIQKKMLVQKMTQLPSHKILTLIQMVKTQLRFNLNRQVLL